MSLASDEASTVTAMTNFSNSVTQRNVDESRDWEKFLGSSTIDRMKGLGRETMNWRYDTKGAAAPSKESLEQFSYYIHKTGGQMLQMKLSDETRQEIAERQGIRMKKSRLNKIVRKKIKADEMDDNLVGIVMDKEWDTSQWSKQDILAGCEALMMIFQGDDEHGISDEKKAQAILMLEKLTFRHEVAADFLRDSLDPLIARASSKKYKGGQSAAELDILYILHNCREKYRDKFSEYQFVGRFCDLMNLEAKLAATLIQHAYRAHLDYIRPKELALNEQGFGTYEEMSRLRHRALNERSNELRAKWGSMHWIQKKEERKIHGGIRGPVHIREVYMNMGMQILTTLLCETGGSLAHGNRIDFVRYNGILLLTGFISAPTGQFANHALKVLTNVAKCADSLYDMLYNGVATAAFRYIKHITQVLNSVVSNNFLDAVNMIQRLSVHAAGVFRARGGYDYIKPKFQDVEEENYMQIINSYPPRSMLPHDIIKLLAPPLLLKELSRVVTSVHSVVTTRCVLNCFFSLACSDCILPILTQICDVGGILMAYLIERLEDSDHTIAIYALSIFLQVTTLEEGRKALLTTQINDYIPQYIVTSSNYGRPTYERALLVAAAMSRQRLWRSYDPTALPHRLCEPREMENMFILDILYTLKEPEWGKKQNYTSLVLLPTNYDIAMKFSETIDLFGSMQICEYLTHPDDEKYFYSLSWDKISAVCAILEGISTSPRTACTMFSAGVVKFLAATVGLSKFELLSPRPLAERRASLILNGMIAAANCLTNLCETDKVILDHPFDHLTHAEKFYDHRIKFNTANMLFESQLNHDHVNADIIMMGFENSGVAAALSYIISTMSVSTHNISGANIALSQQAALSAANLLGAYSTMLIRIDENHPELQTLLEAGPYLTKIISKLKDNFGVTDKMRTFLDSMCVVLDCMTGSQSVAADAILHWGVVSAFTVHLPPPLSGLAGEPGYKTRELSYKLGLGYLPASYFDVMTSLCKLERGKIETLNGGFLRRALDKATILQSELEKPHELKIWRDMIYQKRTPPKPSRQRTDTVACLRLINACANYNSNNACNSNEMIFSPSYDIVGLCKSIICIEECPLTDDAYIMASTLLCTLSTDYANVIAPFNKHGLLDILWELLREAEDLPSIILENTLQLLYNQVCGPLDEYVISKIEAMFDTLTRTARILPECSNKISEIKWKLLDDKEGPAARKIKRRTTDDEWSKVDEYSVELSGAMSRVTDDRNIDERQDDRSVGETTINSENTVKSAESAASQEPGYAGTYHVCGISTCGSLRFPTSPSKHGAYLHMSDEDMEQELMKLPQCAAPSREDIASMTENDKRNNLYVLELSRLSGKEPGFLEMLKTNKAAAGFTEKPPLDIKNLSATGSTKKGMSKLKVITDFDASQSPYKAQLTPLEGGPTMSPISPLTNTMQSIPISEGQQSETVDFPLLSEEDMKAFGITRVDTAKSSTSKLSNSKKGLSGNIALGSPSPSSTRGSPKKKSSHKALIRSVDLSDAPELKMTKPPPPVNSKSMKSSTVNFNST